jgi:hypothetical protein
MKFQFLRKNFVWQLMETLHQLKKKRMISRLHTPTHHKPHGFFRCCPTLFVVAFFLSGCAWIDRISETPAQRQAAQLLAESRSRHAEFRSRQDWRRLTFEDPVVMESLTADNAHLVVSLADQRTLLFAGDRVAVDFPVATGKRSHPTPQGSFTIIDKVEKHSSNLFGKILDEEGNVVAGMADRRKAEIPEGGGFVGSPMPYWMRLTNDGVGFHVGHLPGRPASHGCIRMPRAIAPKIFRSVRLGTPVEIVQQFDPATPPAS